MRGGGSVKERAPAGTEELRIAEKVPSPRNRAILPYCLNSMYCSFIQVDSTVVRWARLLHAGSADMELAVLFVKVELQELSLEFVALLVDCEAEPELAVDGVVVAASA